jgi:hypothetical protein
LPGVHRIRFLNPRSDQAFVQRVETIIGDGTEGAGELETELRKSYPDAVVVERGLKGDASPAWFVYREGRWVPEE